MGVGKERLGPFSVELQHRLFAAIDMLALQKRLPERPALVSLVSVAKDWHEVVRQLELKAQSGIRATWAYAAGAFVRRQLNRLLAKSQA